MDSRMRDHLIGLADLNFGWIPLYVATWALQWFTAAFRYLAALAVLWVINAILGFGLPIHALALIIGFAPLIISLGTLILPLGGWWHQQVEGGRRPSEREQAVFEMAFEQLRAADPNLRVPHRWYVLDSTEANALAYADTLGVTRAVLDSPSFPAILAHELGHLNSSDARVSAAVYRITTWPREPAEKPFKLLGFLVSGRLGFWPMRIPWAIYWRHREEIADQYAAKLGQGTALASYLDSYALGGDLPTPFKDFGGTSHPWTEHRIEELEQPSQNS
jgi:Zn-dependent protease with chaperone function